MGNILFEKEVVEYLGLPSIPKKEHDDKTSFDKGVAIVEMYDERKAYAVAKFDSQIDEEPRIVKVFGYEPFFRIKKILVVPSYMTGKDEINDMDLDDESKRKVESVLKEGEEIVNEGTLEDDEFAKLPEWIFPQLTNREEAEAYVRNYRKINRIKGNLPKSDENLKTYLYVIYKNQQQK